MGERIGTSLIERRALSMILLFGFLLGAVLTIAEPDVRLLAYQIEKVMVSDISRGEIIHLCHSTGSVNICSYRPYQDRV
jgi:hypothetical protein